MKSLLLFLLTTCAFAQQKPYSQRMADSFMTWHKDSILIGDRKTARWDYEQGLVLKAFEGVWYRTGDPKYFTYTLNDINQFVRDDGSIRTYAMDEFNIDNVTTGRVLLMLAQQSLPGKEKFQKAAFLLRDQLAKQPRTKEGGFWHKKRYPNQMWLDGLFMAEPFYAEFSRVFNQPENFDDIAKQFALIEKHLVDPKTGLLYHGYDESREQKWADPKTGQSPNFWGRSIGWYAMALVDVLDYFPNDHPQRANLVKYLQRLAPPIVKYQDPKSGCWYQMTTQGARKGNYLEASASCMFVYALAKSVRMGYLDKAFLASAQKGYQGILKNFIETDANGLINLNGTVSVGGLGGTPYRDGSYDYYLSEPIRKNDLKGVGPFIMASLEMEIAPELAVGAGKTVAVDNYFNHEFRKDLLGQTEPFHYTWEDRMHSGFWHWGNTFRELGAKTVTVRNAPTAESLKGVDVYIIVDPDSPKETAKPNYIQPADIKAIEGWVKAGGVLVMMANDTANCETKHFNELAQVFGIRFTDKNRNMVKGKQYEQGKVTIPAGNPVFKQTQAVYIKELATLAVKAPAKALISEEGDVIMATAQIGKGAVFAVGDPWLYNEYTDGRIIPTVFENYKASKELGAWLLRQTRAK
ncbi:glycoside hydrolase family 88 protein [Larkinella terrae]|uniref:Glycoside hydrolase family 88 protein n=1 Tax=Larkinella terrae TaxID=2025311 RepID=A0A7K0ERT6_9BACT|nr:glycoside hydrolase family 88 protein [Larkinella terrae]MRS64520.1 glycoside hydrolase family 88 protein [Larkinella terrae]